MTKIVTEGVTTTVYVSRRAHNIPASNKLIHVQFIKFSLAHNNS